jgi:hypothetical protein
LPHPQKQEGAADGKTLMKKLSEQKVLQPDITSYFLKTFSFFNKF